jgi:4-amino-4-deoxy-L-arabinose transferase-like glycosyltransferase
MEGSRITFHVSPITEPRLKTTSTSPDTLDRHIKWLVGGILLLALGVRVWGLSFGLPYLYHPDEPTYVATSQEMFKKGDLNPHSFYFPSLFYDINALAYIPFYLVGSVTGTTHSLDDIAPPAMLTSGVGVSPRPATFMLGRIISLLFGVGAVLLVYVVGRRLTGSRIVGLLGALLMAISPGNVQHSRYITPDVIQVFFILLAFWGAVLVFQNGRTWHYVFAGLGVGLAASAKYNGVLIVLTLVGAHFLRHGWRGVRDWRLYMALALAPVGFILTTPYALLDTQALMIGLETEAKHYATGHVGMDGDTLRWYLEYLWLTGGPILLLAVVEVARGLYLRLRPVILLSIFPVAYFVFISGFTVRNDRTALPLTPFLYLLASSLLLALARLVVRRRLYQGAKVAIALTVGALVALSMTYSGVAMVENTNSLLERVQSRELARVWIAENVPPGSRVALEAYAPYVDPSRYDVQSYIVLIERTPEWYVENGVEYLVFSQGAYGRFYEDPARDPDVVARYDTLFNTFENVKTVNVGGYEVKVYRVGR